MQDFFQEEDVVTKIVIACLILRGEGTSVHRNRSSHGLAINFGEGEKIYTFIDTGEKISVKENEIIYLPKYSNYNVSINKDSEMYCINYQIAEEKICAPFKVRIKNMEEIIACYQRAEKIWRRKNENAQLLCKSELYKILAEVLKEKNLPYVPEHKSELLKPALNYIHKHYTDELMNMEQLSKLCGISYEYFRKLFHDFYGVSPVRYINNLKLNRAKELLSSGMYSVSEAAFASGFPEVSHFSRFFKANVGILPSEYFEKKQ